MKTAAALASLVAAACMMVPVASAADTGGTQVLLQRTSDGRVILTDRPLEGATTQRTWQVPREDAAAARERSDRVRAESEAVSARIERRLLQEQELAERAQTERMRLALDARRDATLQDPGYGYSTGGYCCVASPVASVIGKPHRPLRRPGSMNRSHFPERPDFLPQGPPPVVGRLR